MRASVLLIVEDLRYKIRRARELASAKYLAWLFLSRLRPGVKLTCRLVDKVELEFSARGNVSRDLFLGVFEPDVVDFFDCWVRPGMTVMDVGANIGVYSVLAAQRVGPTGAVHSFEPTSQSAQQLRRNLELNGLTWVKVNEVAASDRSSRASLYMYDQNAMNSLTAQMWVGRPTSIVDVDTVSLDDYVLQNAIERVDLIKLDVEGAELRVVNGARKLFASEPGPVVVCEFADCTAQAFGYKASALRDYLGTFGYEFYRWNLRERRLVEELSIDFKHYANLICLKQDADPRWYNPLSGPSGASER